MSYVALVSATEFFNYTKIGANVAPSTEIDEYIREMQELDFEVWCDDAFYNALENTTLSINPELYQLLQIYVKPYLILGSYEKFLLWHGVNINKMGLRINLSDTDTNISDKTKSELLADVRNKKNIYLAKLTRRLKQDNYTYDGIVYNFYDEPYKHEPSPSLSIKQVGNRNKFYDKKTRKYI